MAVKSAQVSDSIRKEWKVLRNVQGSAHVIKCYAKETTIGEKREKAYNLLLEYASGGTLADLIKNSGVGGLPELKNVRYLTRCVLKGLYYVHRCGYVHCDLKPANILLVEDHDRFVAKIGDFGLAKRKRKRKSGSKRWRGTRMYLSPESVTRGTKGPPSDIWALGCVVLEMLTGKSPWERNSKFDGEGLIDRIRKEQPKIPADLSDTARDFLMCCFERDPMKRSTAKVLLKHPFVADDCEDERGIEEDKVSDINENRWLPLSSGEERSSFSAEEEEEEGEDFRRRRRRISSWI